MSQDVAVGHLPDAPSVSHGTGVVPGAAHEAEHDVTANNENRKFAMWLFLASEVMFFTVLIAAFLIMRVRYPEEHNVLNIPLTSLNTFLLLMSSFTVVRAIAAVQGNDQKKFVRSLALTGLLGTIFLFVQLFEYSNLGHEGLTITGSPFGTAFFTLTGFHGIHVFIGVLWCGRTFWKSFNGNYSKEDHFGVEFFGLYWHFVDVVWILIFTLVYLI